MELSPPTVTRKSLILNEFFSSVFTKENTNSISHPEQVFTGGTKERLLDVSLSIAEKKLKKLSKNKSPGVDGIHPSLLRKLSNQLSGALSILFRRTIDEGTVGQVGFFGPHEIISFRKWKIYPQTGRVNKYDTLMPNQVWRN